MDGLDAMFDMGLYIHDLSMHGASRDIVLLGSQQSKELTQAVHKVWNAVKLSCVVSDSFNAYTSLFYSLFYIFLCCHV